MPLGEAVGGGGGTLDGRLRLTGFRAPRFFAHRRSRLAALLRAVPAPRGNGTDETGFSPRNNLGRAVARRLVRLLPGPHRPRRRQLVGHSRPRAPGQGGRSWAAAIHRAPAGREGVLRNWAGRAGFLGGLGMTIDAGGRAVAAGGCVVNVGGGARDG